MTGKEEANYGQPVHWRQGLDLACGALHSYQYICCRRDPHEVTCLDCQARIGERQATVDGILDKLRDKLRGET
jgi:hypothetical protein